MFVSPEIKQNIVSQIKVTKFKDFNQSRVSPPFFLIHFMNYLIGVQGCFKIVTYKVGTLHWFSDLSSVENNKKWQEKIL